jgi:hypothetical protein
LQEAELLNMESDKDYDLVGDQALDWLRMTARMAACAAALTTSQTCVQKDS